MPDTDLTEQQASASTKISGASSAGVEDNYLDVDSNGAAKTTIRDPSSGTGVTTTTAGAKQALDVAIQSDGLHNGGVYGNLSVPTANTAVEVKVGGSRLANRKLVTIKPVDNDMYWGYDSSVTTSNGTLIEKGTFMSFSCDPASTFQVWLVCAANSKNARITESI